MNAELPNCSFCDGKDYVDRIPGEDVYDDWWSVGCSNPECTCEIGYFGTKADAVAAWKRRTPPPLPETVEPK